VDIGSYRGRRVDFSRYAASFFNPYLFVGSLRSQLGCGVSALALLTGTDPLRIRSRRSGTHCSDSFMIRLLREMGFRTLRLTQCNVSLTDFRIGARHVVLISQLFQRNEGTWIVLFDGKCYHNFESYNLESLSFLNKPILSAYLVVHPRWQLDAPTKPSPTLKAVSRKGKLTISRLYRSRGGARVVA
jgi:hypothetical protein